MVITGCTLIFDDRADTVTIVKAKTGCTLLKIKLEAACTGTMARVDQTGNHDADNYWIGIKPADAEVFDRNLFGKSKLRITNPVYELD